MTVRARMVLQSVTDNGLHSRTLKFAAVYDASIPEQKRFYDATPWGTLEMQVNNQGALAEFHTGRSYYLDLSPVE